ncbi:ATP-grasp fold amidoligase family protein [Tenacibaculum sp. SSH1-16]|uniref:ATP-grasp fold amidoligase family protein n=1 Tax=Tenacibaculum sp. SSH1-16 TaxID=3136667 RepID=UPI0032C41B3E|nr:ATP-grasp fold amidoligase family protein [Tenacibaculum mesophilum]
MNSIKEFLKNIPYVGSEIKFIKKTHISFLGKEKYIKKKWLREFGYPLNIKNPITFNEKIQWEKIYSNNELAKRCVDKIEVHNYVKELIGEKYLNKIIGVYSNIRDIRFENLPEKFVIKASHDSGSVLVVDNKSNINQQKLRLINKNLKLNYGKVSKEWVYDDIKPRILVENFLESGDEKSLKDYKIFCFEGKPKLIQVDFDRFEEHTRNFYDMDWNRLDFEILYKNADYDVEKPELLNEMIKLSSILAKPFNHVRVDWYISQNKLIFGEMTFFPESGFGSFSSKEWENKLGSYFNISKDLSY